MSALHDRLLELIEEAESGEGIIITPGFSTHYAIETSALREVLRYDDIGNLRCSCCQGRCTCRGRRIHPEASSLPSGEPCQTCNGWGQTAQGWTDKNGYPEDQYGPCPDCEPSSLPSVEADQ